MGFAALLTMGLLPLPVQLAAQSLTQTNYYSIDDSAPGFAVSNTDLLQTSLSSATSTGTFYISPVNLGVLTDGVFAAGYGDSSVMVLPGSATITFALNLTTHANGYSLTGIRTYASWGDRGRDGQAYAVQYSTVSAPSTFVALATVSAFDVPDDVADFGDDSTMVQLTSVSGTFVSNVAALRFVFSGYENGGTGFSEFDVFGVATAVPETSSCTAIAGALALGATLLIRRRRGRDRTRGNGWR